MFSKYLFLLAVTIASVPAAPDTPTGLGTEADVQVDRLPQAIPSEQGAADGFIWDTFSKRPEIRLFLHYTTQDWRKKYDLFAQSLIAKAEKQGFEANSLKQCLAKLLNERVSQGARQEIGYLPIGAYRTTQDGKQVWVIFCLWEYADDPSKAKNDFLAPMEDHAKTTHTPPISHRPATWPTVGHIRMFTYDLSSTELIGFVTCG
jgi:hypothetical protein